MKRTNATPMKKLPSCHPALLLTLFLGLLAALAPGRAGAWQSAPSTASPPAVTMQKDVEWDAGVGLSAFNAEIKSGCWIPVWVEIRANRAPVKGVVTLTQVNNPLRVEVAIDAAKGTRKIYRTYYRPLDTARSLVQAGLDIALDAEPLGHVTLQAPLRFAQPGNRHLLILTDKERFGSFNFLSRQVERNPVTTVLGGQSVIYGQPDLLPEDAIALASLDSMLIDTAGVRTISAAQWSAIRAWVAAGGQLLLASGRNQAFIQQSPLRNPFGAGLGQPEPFPAARLFKGDTPATTTLLASWPAPPPGGWDAICLGDATHPFMAEKRVGAGSFRLCAATLEPAVLDLLRNKVDTSGARLFSTVPAAAPSPLLGLASTHAGELSVHLQSDFSVTLAGVRWVILYLLAYNLVAMPLNRWLCRRFGHPGIFWPLLVALAIGFAWYGYRSGTERQRQTFQINEVTFISRPAGDAPARAVSLTALFTPRRIIGDLPAAGRIFLSLLHISERERNGPISLSFDGGTTLRHVTLFPWTVLSLAGEHTPALKGAVEAGNPILFGPMSEQFSPLSVGLTNNTAYTFRRWWLRHGDWTWTGAAPLDPGASVSGGLAPGAGPVDLASLVLPGVASAFATTPGATPQPAPPAPQSGSQRTRRREDERLYFLGEADGISSPFTQGFPGQKTIGRIYYEQELPMVRAATLAGPAQWDPESCAPRLTWVDKEPVDSANDAFWLQNSSDNSVFFPLNRVTLAIAPRRPPAPQEPLPHAIELALAFTSHPKPGSIWTQQSSGRHYRMWTCPMEIFNYQLNQWEPLNPRLIDKAQPLTATLLPARDYLDPETWALTLRLDAEPDKVVYKLTQLRAAELPPGSDPEEMITGKQLFNPRFGSQLPVTIQDLKNEGIEENMNPDAARLGLPHSAQVTQFRINLIK